MNEHVLAYVTHQSRKTPRKRYQDAIDLQIRLEIFSQDLEIFEQQRVQLVIELQKTNTRINNLSVAMDTVRQRGW